MGFLIGTITSILDSIGDYYACAKMCNLPPPPSHSVNRGIAVEGFCSLIAGFLGCGHATTTYGGNLGAIGVTKVKHGVFPLKNLETSFLLLYVIHSYLKDGIKI